MSPRQSTTDSEDHDMQKASRWRPISVVFGGMLLHLSLGTIYTFGNLNPYLTSYMRNIGPEPNLKYTECSWIFAVACMGQGTSMFLGGLLEKKLGPRLTTLLGCWFMSLGVFLTYFSVKQSFALTVVTYGLMFGLGVGIAYAVPLSCAVKWLPEKKGLVNGFIVAGFGGGAFIFDQVQTAYINPHNLKPDVEKDGEKYFSQRELLDKVPTMFLTLGACYAVMQFIGSMLLCNPPAKRTAKISNDEEGTDIRTKQQQEGDDDRALLLNVTHNQAVKGKDENDVAPLQMLKSKYFYMLFFMFLLNGQGIIFISTLYKAYGQSFIQDDTFLSLVGTLAAVFNGVGRIFWGTLADKYSFRVAALIMNTSFTCLMLTFQLSHLGGKPLFLIYVCLLFGSFSGAFSLFPTATAKCFGRKYMAINYGLVFTNIIITSPLGVFTSQSLMSTLGWTGLFFVVSGCSFCSLLLNVAFRAKDKHGKEI